MSRAPITVLGDALLDRALDGRAERLCPEGPVPVVDRPAASASPGGAALAAILGGRDGRRVSLVTALGDDAAGRELAALLDEAGVHVVDLGLAGATAEKVRIRADGRLLLRLDRGELAPVGAMTGEAKEALAGASGVLVADYGRGLCAHAGVRQALGELPGRLPVVWDPHPRGAPPLPGAHLCTPNLLEARALVDEIEGDGLVAATRCARVLCDRWRAGAVAVTLGDRGAVMASAGVPPLVVPARAVLRADPCGAGDRFASAAAGLLADGAPAGEAVAGAVAAASAFVAAGGLASLASAPAALGSEGSAEEVVARVRAAGGTVVATGGCFDLLHAGHVSMLAAARSLGDCLVVCLNSDDSVRRLKGDDRPLVPEEDRAAVLAALSSVDAVAIFDEATPAALLERLRPDVFAKGADYAVGDLPEAAVVAAWGGETVILPYVAGRSTTRLIEDATGRAVG